MKTTAIRKRVLPTKLAGCALMVMLLAPAAFASEPVGRVIAVVGNVVAVVEGETARGLSRQDAVYPGETIVTEADSRAQIRFRDEGLVDLKPETELAIEQYREPTEEQEGSAVMDFLGGAMRTITGAIGDNPEDEYELKTPTASIGIRGTEYSLQYCDAECAGGDRQLGLYGRVDDGAVEVSNEQGTGEFDEDSYFFVAPDSAPERRTAPPQSVLDGSEDGSDDEEEEDEADEGTESEEESAGDGDEDEETGSQESEDSADGEAGDEQDMELAAEDETELDTAEDEEGDIELEADEFQAGEDDADDTDDAVQEGYAAVGITVEDLAGVGVLFPGIGFARDEEGQLIRLEFDSALLPDGSELTEDETESVLDMSEMTSEEFGSTTVDDVEVTWGRWSGDFELLDEPYKGGIAYAFVDAADISEQSVLEGLGSATYSYADGPLAPATDGSLWDVEVADFTFDFATEEITGSSLDLMHQDRNLTITLSGADGTVDLESGTFLVQQEGSVQQLESSAAGFSSGAFVGSDGEGGVFTFWVEYEDLEDLEPVTKSLSGSGVLELER